jgi:UDP-N-acetylmuramoyl-tripeptide--D-alanyl-D-alanine ligase
MSAPLMQLDQVHAWLQARQAGHSLALHGAPATAITRVHTDSRSVQPGDLFVALQGESFDANAFLAQAQAAGAVAVLCRAGLDVSQLPAGLPRIEVPDTTLALGHLAQAWRQQFAMPLIAVTGSNGKTTVTQMIAAILQAHAPDGGALATQGNLNNAIGVPLTLLRLRASHRIAVVELGMNHPGEIAYLAAMAQPTVALVNNAQREHLEFMHTVDAVAAENGAVLQALGPQGCAVFPADDPYSALWQSQNQGARHLGFVSAGPHTGDGVYGLSAQWHESHWQVQAHWQANGHSGVLHFRLAIAGAHNVRNALAAAACALAAGVAPASIEAGLQAFAPVKGRSRAFALQWGTRRISAVDDSYNANPDSVRAAIDVLHALPAPRLLVLGDMGEVGQDGAQLHAEAGAYAHSQGIEQLLAMGNLSESAVQAFSQAGGQAQHCADIDALDQALQTALPLCASVLVKGSRFMRMERAIERMQTQAADLAQHTHGESVHAA